MDRRHYLESQRSHLSAHQGLPGSSFPSPQIRGRPPISPILRSPVPHQSPPPLHSERFPAAAFPGRIQPHLAPIGQTSHHLLERQMEFKEASLIQAKLAQQRAATHMLTNPVTHPPVGEERVQYIPTALQPNLTPEDSLAQLRRLHQQVLSMPSHETQYFELPSAGLPSASRSREVSRDLQETAELLRLSTKERMIMEQHMLNSKQQLTERGYAHLMEESLRCKSSDSRSPFAVPRQPNSPPVNRPTATRPPVLPCPNTISHEVNLRLQQKLAAENSRRIQEMEKQQLQEHYPRRTATYAYKPKSTVSPNAVVVPHSIPQRSGHSYDSLVRPTFFKGKGSKPCLEPGAELQRQNVPPQTMPQIKDVKSLAQVKNEIGGSSLGRIDQRDLLLKMMENRIKQELDKEEEPCSSSHTVDTGSRGELQNSSMIKVPLSPSPSSTTPSIPDRLIKEEPVERSTCKQGPALPKDLSISACQTSSTLPVVENKPSRKRPMKGHPPSPIIKRSRGAGDIFRARLADYTVVSSSRPGENSSSHIPAFSETSYKQNSAEDSLDQPLDLSVPASHNLCKLKPERKEEVSPVHHESKPMRSPSDQSQPGSRGSMKTTTTISEIISEAVIASLDRPYTVQRNKAVPTCNTDEVTPSEESAAKLQSSTSASTESVRRVNDSDTESSPASEEECQKQLIDVLSTQFAGSFRNFLVSLLRECKNDSIVKALAISKAGQRVPIVMKEELERCNAKISQTIRTLLESDDYKESPRMVQRKEANSEEGIEKDKSPPCQVSTTTDIWQHSPPGSPSDCISASKALDSVKPQGDDLAKESGNARQFEEEEKPHKAMESSGNKVARDETKMPLIMNVESLASSFEEECSGVGVALETEDKDSVSDVPLFIDDGFRSVSPSERQTEIESSKPNVVQSKVEEDAIDLLKFGNDEIDQDEDKRCDETGEKNDPMVKEDTPYEDTKDNSVLHFLETKAHSDKLDSVPGAESSRPTQLKLDSENSKGRGAGTLGVETPSVKGNEMTTRVSVSSIGRCAMNEGGSAMSVGNCSVGTLKGVTSARAGKNGTVDGMSAGDSRMSARAVQSKYQQILPKQSTTVVASEQQTPLSIVSPPITIALPKVYQIDPVPSTQILQIIPSPVTSNIVGTLATPVNSTAVPSVTISSLVPPGSDALTPTIQPLQSQGSVIVSSVTSDSSTATKQVVAPVASPSSSPSSSSGFSFKASPSTSTSSQGSTSTQNGKVPISTVSRLIPPGTKGTHASVPLMWKGNALIPHNSPQETPNPKKPFVPAYTVVYHSAHLPCVVRSSVPFVPPKILWKSLFMSVTFTDFNKTLSTCSILQRYMTVLEQAALQKDLTSNGISSCKLVPLDEFDSKYHDVEEQLAKISTGSVAKDDLQS